MRFSVSPSAIVFQCDLVDPGQLVGAVFSPTYTLTRVRHLWASQGVLAKPRGHEFAVMGVVIHSTVFGGPL